MGLMKYVGYVGLQGSKVRKLLATQDDGAIVVARLEHRFAVRVANSLCHYQSTDLATKIRHELGKPLIDLDPAIVDREQIGKADHQARVTIQRVWGADMELKRAWREQDEGIVCADKQMKKALAIEASAGRS